MLILISIWATIIIIAIFLIYLKYSSSSSSSSSPSSKKPCNNKCSIICGNGIPCPPPECEKCIC